MILQFKHTAMMAALVFATDDPIYVNVRSRFLVISRLRYFSNGSVGVRNQLCVFSKNDDSRNQLVMKDFFLHEIFTNGRDKAGGYIRVRPCSLSAITLQKVVTMVTCMTSDFNEGQSYNRRRKLGKKIKNSRI